MGGLRRHRPAPAEVLGLHDAWRAWVIDALASGAAPAEIARELVAEGVAAELAWREIDVLRAAAGAIHEARNLAQRRELALRLAGAASGDHPIERRGSVDAGSFYRHYWAASRPVILTDTIARWPQVATWSPAWFRRRFADATLRVTADRDADPDYDINTEAHTRTMTVAGFVDRMAAGASNDVYVVARNRNLGDPPFRSLVDELTDLPPFLDRARLPGCVSLWFGPAGTRTPLHHDTCNILFCQIHGAKRLWLVSPREPAMLERMRGVYSTWDCEAERPAHLGEVTVHEVELTAGEALYIPVGWWHQVRSLTPSISLSFTNFTRPNRFEWYKPGAHRAV